MRSFRTPKHINKFVILNNNNDDVYSEIQKAYIKLRKDQNKIDVSVIIPAYNEEANIIKTLASLSNNTTPRSVEIIVVNNNSTDKTAELVKKAGIDCVLEEIQGIEYTRTTGLHVAKGKYILNADADTIYPKDWIEEMVKPLDNNRIAITYGKFSFIPTGTNNRTIYFFYEYIAEVNRFLNKYLKEEAVNVYGFNSALRKYQGIAVNGFMHPKETGTVEDGWMAYKLRESGYGRLYRVTKKRALVWTTDRRIHLDGGMFSGIIKRAVRILTRK